MDNTLLQNEKDNINKERNNNILKLLISVEENYKETRKLIYNLLDDEYKPQIVDMSFKNHNCLVNILDKNESNSFMLDNEDDKKLFDLIRQIYNTEIDSNNISGGKLYKYRENGLKLYTGLKF